MLKIFLLEQTCLAALAVLPSLCREKIATLILTDPDMADISQPKIKENDEDYTVVGDRIVLCVTSSAFVHQQLCFQSDLWKGQQKLIGVDPTPAF